METKYTWKTKTTNIHYIQRPLSCWTYVEILQARKYRAVCAKLRIGILPLEIETGRWRSIQADRRFCKLCSIDCVENETHFVFYCSKYAHLIDIFVSNVKEIFPHIDLLDMPDSIKWQTIMSPEIVLVTCKYLSTIFDMRQTTLFQ